MFKETLNGQWNWDLGIIRIKAEIHLKCLFCILWLYEKQKSVVISTPENLARRLVYCRLAGKCWHSRISICLNFNSLPHLLSSFSLFLLLSLSSVAIRARCEEVIFTSTLQMQFCARPQPANFSLRLHQRCVEVILSRKRAKGTREIGSNIPF